MPANTVVDWFFFKPDDPRLVDGTKRFSKTLSDDLLRKKWEEIRPKLVEVCSVLHPLALLLADLIVPLFVPVAENMHLISGLCRTIQTCELLLEMAVPLYQMFYAQSQNVCNVSLCLT